MCVVGAIGAKHTFTKSSAHIRVLLHIMWLVKVKEFFERDIFSEKIYFNLYQALTS